MRNVSFLLIASLAVGCGQSPSEVSLETTDAPNARRPYLAGSIQGGKAVISPDGKFALHRAALCDLHTGRRIRYLEGGGDLVAFSPDGLLALTGLHAPLTLSQVATGKVLRRFVGHGAVSLAFSPDGKRALSGDANGTVTLWDVSTAQEIRTLLAHHGSVFSVAFSPDGKLAASSDLHDRKIKLWDVETGEEKRSIAHASLRVSFSPDGRFLLSARPLKIWNVASGAEVEWTTGERAEPGTGVFLPDGKRILTLAMVPGHGSKRPALWDFSTGQLLRNYTQLGPWDECAISPDSKVALLFDDFGNFVAIDLDSGQELCAPGPARSDVEINPLALSPNGKLAVTGDCIVWDVTTRTAVRKLEGQQPISSVAFSPDAARLILGGSEWARKGGIAEVWDVANGKMIQRLKGHHATILSVALSGDGKWALTGSSVQRAGIGFFPGTSPENAMKLWDVASGKVLRSFIGPGGADFVAFLPDGKHVVAADSGEKLLYCWSLSTGKLVWKRDTSEAWRVKAAPGDKFVLRYGWKLKVWDLTTGKEQDVPVKCEKPIEEAALSPDGKFLLWKDDSGFWDDRGFLHVTDVATGRLIRDVPKRSGTWGMALTAEPSLLLFEGDIPPDVPVGLKIYDVVAGKDADHLSPPK